jgi:peptidyl-prolyl cis-trans isomerase SurA
MHMMYSRALALGVCSLSLLAAADVTLVEEIVAKVNGDIVTRSEVEHGQRMLEAELRQQQGLTVAKLREQVEQRQKDVFRDRIDQLLLVQKGKELNINVDGDISKFVARLQAESKIADPEKFQQYVREQTGMSFEDYKNDLKNNLLTERVIRDEVSRRVQVKRDEQQKYYEEHKSDFMREERVFLREILISTEGKDAAGIAAAEKKGKDITARATKGEKFSDLARDNSDAQTSKQGGDIGGFEKGKLRPDIEGAVWTKSRGFVTPPIKVDNGFLILRVEDHQKAGQASFEEMENEIMDKIFTPRMQPAIREYLTKLRQDAFLEIKPGYVDSGAAPGKDTTWNDPAQLRPETITKGEVSSKGRHKKLLWMIPIPGTNTADTKPSSSKK